MLAVGGDAAGASEVGGELAAQLGHAARVRVAEPAVGHAAQGLAGAAQPLGAREGGEVGRAGEEVVPERGRPGRARRGFGRCLAGAHGAHVGAGAGAALEPALGAELVVGLDHEPPGHAEVARQHARRGQARPGLEPPGADRLAQPGLELSAQRGVLVAPQLDQDLRANGPLLRHWIGPYYGSSSAVACRP